VRAGAGDEDEPCGADGLTVGGRRGWGVGGADDVHGAPLRGQGSGFRKTIKGCKGLVDRKYPTLLKCGLYGAPGMLQTRRMAKEFFELWRSIEVDLARARQTLPEVAAHHEAVRAYEEFIDHNELELACDALERYAEDYLVSREFWLALRDAAVKMELLDRASRYEQKISN